MIKSRSIGNEEWNLSFRRALFQWELEELRRMKVVLQIAPKLRNGVLDRLSWAVDRSGTFTISSVYKWKESPSTMPTKVVAFYSLIVYFATSMGTHTVAAHQVVMQLYGMCTVFGGPLCQTAQSFMPRLMYRVNRSPVEARRLSKSMVIIGSLSGLILGSIGTFVPLMFPNFFSPDPEVIGEMDKVLIPYLPALCVTHRVHSLEGTLLSAPKKPDIIRSMAYDSNKGIKTNQLSSKSYVGV
ncbi:hypothetical protein LOK49_LG05G01998 [Camellia lanceoleosa]|uniref:Uncharacterized protein n=1 Tax=Camellia lanceoleosa TaxID=1840588 RepID=A0ACC0HWN2_9ERIC|nr:hypothetical protein LOK49_LG05G01998 [Camellia lanceoleosa]